MTVPLLSPAHPVVPRRSVCSVIRTHPVMVPIMKASLDAETV